MKVPPELDVFSEVTPGTGWSTLLKLHCFSVVFAPVHVDGLLVPHLQAQGAGKDQRGGAAYQDRRGAGVAQGVGGSS